MPIVLKFSFPAGRYHATPWGRHVNEGTPEWPPSPWRIARSIIAVWRRTLQTQISQDEIFRVLASLCQPPLYRVPPYRIAHTRHAMPINLLAYCYKPSKTERKDEYQGDPTIVFDTFVVVDRDSALFVGWPNADLETSDIAALSELLHNLTSLGRAESWVDASVAAATPEWNCGPAGPDEIDPVPLLCLDPDSAFSNEYYPQIDLKKAAQGKLKVSERLFDCPQWHLCLDTATIHSKRWSAVPGSKWVNYTRPSEDSAVALTRRSYGCANVARYLLDGPVLPAISETLPLAEAARRRLMGLYGRLAEYNGVSGRSATVSGKDEQGVPLSGHRHAYYLPTDDDGDGRIDHLTIVAAAGFSDVEQRALASLRELIFGHGRTSRTLRLLMLTMSSLGSRNGIVGESRRWISATPYIATRYAKTRGRDRIDLVSATAKAQFVALDLQQQISTLLNVDPTEVIIEPLCDANDVFRVPVGDGTLGLRPIEFKRFRSKADDDGGNRLCGAFRLEFARSIRGPIALGHSAHFGMGAFRPL